MMSLLQKAEVLFFVLVAIAAVYWFVFVAP